MNLQVGDLEFEHKGTPKEQISDKADSTTDLKLRLVVVGSSGHARVVLDAIEEEGRFHIVGLLDTYKLPGSETLGYQTIGSEEDLAALIAAGVCDSVIVAVGDNWKRGQVVARIKKTTPDVSFATVVHPSARIASGVSIGRGTVVMAGAIVNTGARVGEFCILNTGSSLDHDGVMEDFSSLAPRAVTGGAVWIGTFTAIAIGATISHDIHIGEHTVIGAGATVLEDMPASVVAYGTPARIIRARNPDDPYLGHTDRRSDPALLPSPHIIRKFKSLAIILASSEAWQGCLDRTSHDFFHTPEYHQVQEHFMGGEAHLAVYGDADKFIAWPYLLQPIDKVENTAKASLRDVTSVYGFSGPVTCGCEHDPDFLSRAWEAIVDVWSNQGAVSAFTRFHPILDNQAWSCGRFILAEHLGRSGHIEPLGKTVAVQLSNTQDEIWRACQRQGRQAVRRCQESGMVSKADPQWSYFKDFVRLYYGTMRRNEAAAFYFFPGQYLGALKNAARSSGSLFVTIYQGKVIAAGLLLEYGGIVNLHLLATDNDYAHLSPSKLLVHDAVAWAKARGNHVFHLGGGRGCRDDDSLFRFKALFSRTFLPFHIGRWILDKPAYEFLVERRRTQAGNLKSKEIDPLYFPAYRAPFIQRPEHRMA